MRRESCSGSADDERLELVVRTHGVEQPIACGERTVTPARGLGGSEVTTGDSDVAPDRMNRCQIDLRHVAFVAALKALEVDLLAALKLLFGGVTTPANSPADIRVSRPSSPRMTEATALLACERLSSSRAP